MKEIPIQAITELLSSVTRSEEGGNVQAFYSKLSGKRFDRPVIKVFEEGEKPEEAIIIIIILVGPILIVVVVF